MKTLLLVTITFGGVLFSQAQETIVKGRVSDYQDNPIPLAHIILQQSDTRIEGTVTDIDGYFLFNKLKAGNYDLKIVALGYGDYSKSISVITGINNLGDLPIEESSVELDEVELIAEKGIYQRRDNSLVVNVEKSIAGSGGSTLNLLTNATGVRVNQQNGALSMNGRGQVIILMNGKPTGLDGTALTTLLQGMPASNIQSLEVFSNPPAKFESNGSGGVINIRTKTKNSGLNGGNLSLSSGFGTGEKSGASVDFQMKHKNMSWFGGYSFSRNRFLEEWGLRSDFEHIATSKSVTTTSDREPVTTAHNYTTGLEYSLSPNTDIGGHLSGYNTKWNMIAFDAVNNSEVSGNSSILNIETKEINRWNHINGSTYLSHRFRDSTQFTINYDYLHYRDNNPSSYSYDINESNFFTQIIKQTPISFNVINVDYSRVLFKTVHLGLGGKTTFSHFSNSIWVSNLVDENMILDTDLSTLTKMKEKVYALYASFNFQYNDKLRFTAGIRYEHTDNKTRNEQLNYHRIYNSIFPSVTISQRVNKEHRLQFNYGRRINRPTFNNLAPYVLFLGPDALYSGNPILKPSFVNLLGVEWDWGGRHLSIEYLTEKNPIVEFQPRLSPNESQYIFKAENMDHKNVLSLTLGFPWKVTAWWSMENTFIYQYENLEFPFQGSIFKRDKGVLRFQGLQHITLGKRTKLEINGNYQSATLFGISTFGGRGTLNIGLQQILNNNHGSLKLSISNLLASDNWRIKTNTSQPLLNTLETYYPESGIVMLTYSRRLGSIKRRLEPRDNHANEERGRVQ